MKVGPGGGSDASRQTFPVRVTINTIHRPDGSASLDHLRSSAPKRGAASRPLSARWALYAGLVGPAVAVFCLAVEPPPANPNAPEPLVVTVLGFALMIAWAGAAIAAARRRPVALRWAGFVGALSMAMTISCPLSGHHTAIGMWWVSQFVVSAGAWTAAVVGKYSIDHP